MYIDVDVEFGRAVEAVGGIRADSLPRGTFPGKNADYVFHEHRVVAELKCLDKDRIHDEKAVAIASKHYADALERGKAPVVVFGTTTLTTDGFEDDFRQKIMEIYSPGISRSIRDADLQIADTKLALGLSDYKGLLLLVNNSNSALHPANMVELVGNALRPTTTFPNINSAIIFTVNMYSDYKGKDTHIWYSGNRFGISPIDDEFERKLQEAWFRHHSVLVGQPIETIRGSRSMLSELENYNQLSGPRKGKGDHG